MKGQLEREIKLDANDVRLDELEGEPLPVRRFTSTYFDTPDFRLARVGITLRKRVELGQTLWQLKLPREGARFELESRGGAAAPPTRLRQLLAAFLHGRQLIRVATLRTVRRGVLVVAESGAAAEVLVDEVDVMEGRRVGASFTQLEIEARGDGDGLLPQLERRVRRAGARKGDARPKLFRALGLEATEPPTRGDSAHQHLRLMLLRQYDEILRHDPGTRLGDEAEDLHRFRVAVRRLRAALRAGRPLLDASWSEPLRTELAWLGRTAGPVRDLDVLIGHLRDEKAALGEDGVGIDGLIALLEEEWSAARARLLEVLRGERYLELLSALEEAAGSPHTRPADLSLRDLAGAEFRALVKAKRRLGKDPSDAELHELRIRGKRARYAAELASDELGAPAARFVRKAKRFQDVVGSHQDAIVAEERLRALLRGSRSKTAAFAAGRIVERQRARRKAARTDARDAWSRLEASGRRTFA